MRLKHQILAIDLVFLCELLFLLPETHLSPYHLYLANPHRPFKAQFRITSSQRWSQTH